MARLRRSNDRKSWLPRKFSSRDDLEARNACGKDLQLLGPQFPLLQGL